MSSFQDLDLSEALLLFLVVALSCGFAFDCGYRLGFIHGDTHASR